MSTTPVKRLSAKRRVFFVCLLILITLGLLEGGTRLYDLLRPSELEPYKRFSADPALGYELIPNYRARTPNGKRDAILINSRGYRGPEFEPEKAAGTTRIICLGDSCTFEGIPEAAPYPRRLEEQLNSSGDKFEVINAAVEGYDSNKALIRLKQALEYHPDIVTIYIGWNDLYRIDPEQTNSGGALQKIAEILQYSHFVAKLRNLIFVKLRPKLKVRAAQKGERYQQFMPASYEANLRAMIELTHQHNARVWLITLPSILSAQISDAGLARAQFPYFTNSVADMTVLIERYNEVIRRVAKETNTPLIELAIKFDQMENKEQYFSDTIHMYNDAKPLIASEIKAAISGSAVPASNQAGER